MPRLAASLLQNLRREPRRVRVDQGYALGFGFHTY